MTLITMNDGTRYLGLRYITPYTDSIIIGYRYSQIHITYSSSKNRNVVKL